MPKSSKKTKEATLSEVAPAAPTSEAQNATGPDLSEKGDAQKPPVAAVKSARKPRSAAPRKPATSLKPRKSPLKKKPAPAQVAVSDDEIRLRAYFLAEHRVRDGIAGDSGNDWLEARRQLLAEAAGRA